MEVDHATGASTADIVDLDAPLPTVTLGLGCVAFKVDTSRAACAFDIVDDETVSGPSALSDTDACRSDIANRDETSATIIDVDGTDITAETVDCESTIRSTVDTGVNEEYCCCCRATKNDEEYQ